MASIPAAEQDQFFQDVDAASEKAVWAAVATVSDDAPRVRLVHPTWEGRVLWFATGTGSPKHVQLEKNPQIDVQYQVAPPDFIHVLIRGAASIVTDEAEKKRVWGVMNYDLADFWPDGPTDPNYTLIRIDPTRVELSKMFGSMDKQVWRPS
jgi:general stress protein 26